MYPNVLLDVALTCGVGETLTVVFVETEHPYASINVTVYVVVELGETTIVDPLPKLLSHWYVPALPAPEAINVALSPWQMV